MAAEQSFQPFPDKAKDEKIAVSRYSRASVTKKSVNLQLTIFLRV
jgi:hypothetical protein